MKKIIVLNHKINLLYDDVIPYIMNLNMVETENNIIVCPSNIYLESFLNYCDWGIGSQSVSNDSSKNNTGKISALQLKSLGIEYVIVGHSDLNEDASDINLKLITLLDSNIIPILCLNDDEKDVDKLYNDFLRLTKGISNYETLILAYINNKDIEFTLMEEKVKKFRNMVKNNCSKEISIIYGGNINSNNIDKVKNSNLYDGYMLGSVSSNVGSLKKLL